MTNFLKLTGSFWINLYFLNMKFHEKIFTTIKVIQLWNFGNFGTSEIIPENLVTLRFLKVSLHELKGICKCFQTRYWPNFYIDPTYSNTCFSKLANGKFYCKALYVICALQSNINFVYQQQFFWIGIGVTFLNYRLHTLHIYYIPSDPAHFRMKFYTAHLLHPAHFLEISQNATLHYC